MTRGAPVGNEPPPPFPVEQWRLANGLRVVVQPDPRSPLVASVMCYDAGSRYDPPSRSGLAHLCEHLAFDGPRRASGRTFQERIDRLGGLPQAVTTPDRLCFSAVFPHAALAAVLAVEAERMVSPLDPRDAGALDIQRRVLIEELHHRSRRRVRPVAFEHLHRALFHERHPYHRPPAGQPDDIRALTSTDVEELVASRFSPRRAVLVLAGGLSAEAAAGCVERTFGTLAAGAERAPEPVVASQPQPATQSRRVAADVAGTHVLVAWSVDGLGQGEWYLASLLMRGLSAGRSSPLTEALVERAGLAREVRGHLVSMRDASTLAFAAVAAAGVSSERLEQGLVEAIDRLLASGLSPGDLRRARKRAWIDHFLAIQKIERRADLCASFSCCLDAPERLETEPLRYLAPDRDDLAAFASRLRQRQARATLSLVPRMEAA